MVFFAHCVAQPSSHDASESEVDSGSDSGSDSDLSLVSDDRKPQSDQCDLIGTTMAIVLNSLKTLPPRVPRPRQQFLPENRQTVIFVDWDDTLLCTTFLANKHGRTLPEQLGSELARISDYVKNILALANRLGQLFIVTNAEEGWVEASTRLWLPQLMPIIEAVTILSARSLYEKVYPDDASMWKRRVFLDVRKNLRSELPANLISIGDSPYEMAAVAALGRTFKDAFVKTVRFQVAPSPQVLSRELAFVAKELEMIERAARGVNLTL